jgi:glycosyltransferase involved in cell wall biosynthesis
MGKAANNVSWVHIDLKTKHWSKVFFRNDMHERSVYEKMDRIVFVSGEARDKFLELFDVDESRCCVQYNLIDARMIRELAQSKKIDTEKLTVCMVGRLNPQKRYDRALRAVKRLKDDGIDFVLWILGEGGLEGELRSMITDLGIEDYVQLKGFVKPSYAYMHSADIYWNTSEAEGYPLVVCEALCLGLPVVATAICGTNEILGNGRYGLLTGEDDESIYRGMKSMLKSAALRCDYAAKALEGATAFDVKAVMNDIYMRLEDKRGEDER